MAHKAYDMDGFRKALTDDGIAVVIPSKKNRLHPRSHDRDIYKERNRVERFFRRLSVLEGWLQDMIKQAGCTSLA